MVDVIQFSFFVSIFLKNILVVKTRSKYTVNAIASCVL